MMLTSGVDDFVSGQFVTFAKVILITVLRLKPVCQLLSPTL